MNNLLLVFLGGGLGSIARFGIAEFTRTKFQFLFPFATFCSNVLSCIILALAVGFFKEKIVTNPSLRVLILAGFCGGFSTFSSFSYETVNLFKEGFYLYAIANILVSMITCMALIYFMTKNT